MPDTTTAFAATRDPWRRVSRHDRATARAIPEQHVPTPHQAQQHHGSRRKHRSDLLSPQADYESRLADASYDHLIAKVGDEDRPDGISIYLSTMQRMVIHDLQRELANLVSDIRDDGKATPRRMETAKRLLDDYCECDYIILVIPTSYTVWVYPAGLVFGRV